MKLHDLRPAEGSRKERIRVGRGIAAGKGKTAGRGTKGQKARAGGSIPPWFEGGQTPLHMRIPKLRGFKNRARIEYEVVNVGAITAAVERGAFEGGAPGKAKGAKAAAAQITVNQDLLRAVGLVRTLNKPLKILGTGEVSAALFVVADAFTASARTKIEGAGGTVSVLEVPSRPLKAIGVDAPAPTEPTEPTDMAETADSPAETAAAEKPKAPTKAAKRGTKAEAAADTDAEPAGTAEPEPAADATTTTDDEEPEAATSDAAESTSGDDA
jgi:large subunit ribosomal protein L15